MHPAIEGLAESGRHDHSVGQFMPGRQARPAIGDPGKLEFVEEDRVEVVVNDKGGENVELKTILKELKEVGSS